MRTDQSQGRPGPLARARASLPLYFRPRPVAAFLLGISSGFPLTLLLATMTFWLSRAGVDKTTIGFAVGLTTPYTLKFLWAPLIDRMHIPLLTRWLGQRRSWLLLIGALLAGAVIMLGQCDPVADLPRFAVWAVAVAFLSATQDIIIDAYRIEILSDAELPYGTATNQFGYRVGSGLIAGALTVWLASGEGAGLGWSVAYGLTSLTVLFGISAALWVGEPNRDGKPASREGHQFNYADWLTTTVIGPFRDFLRLDGAMLILLFILIYKLGDAMGQIMLGPMIVELGFSDTAYINANKLIGFWALIAGSAVGPLCVASLGMGRALFWSGALMMLSNLAFAALAMIGNEVWALGAAVGIENFTSGLGLTVFATFLAGLCSLKFTATQYALLSSVAAIGRTFLSAPSGYLAEALNWPLFYVGTTIVALPGMLLLWLIWRRGYISDAVRAVRN